MAVVNETRGSPRASSFFIFRGDRFTISWGSDEWIAEVMAEPLCLFDISQKILATVCSNAPKIPNDIDGCISHLTKFPVELCLMIASQLTYCDLVLLALTCKSMAIPILKDPLFSKIAAAEEAKHIALGHFEIVVRAFPHLTQHRSKLWCSHYTCPFHMRRLRNWNWKVAKAMKRLKEEQKQEAEMQDLQKLRESDEQLPWSRDA